MKIRALLDQRSLRLLYRCMGYFWPYTWYVLVATLSMLVVGGATAYGAYLVQPALDEIFINKDRAALVWVPIQVLAAFAAKGFFRYLQNYLMRTSSTYVLETVRDELYNKIIRLPLEFFEESRVGRLMSLINADTAAIRSSFPAVIMLVRQLFTMLCLIGVVFYQNYELAVWAILVLPLGLYPFVYFGKRLRRIGRTMQANVADVMTFLQETFSGVRVVKAFAAEKREGGRFHDVNREQTDIQVKSIFYSEMSSPIMDFVGAIGVAVVIWYGGLQVIEGQSTPGTFFSFLAALVMLYEPFKKMNAANLQIQQALAGAERVFDLLDSEEVHEEPDGETEFDGEFESLAFEGVTFGYPGCSRPAIDNVDLHIRKGQTVAIVGPSGAGKTTLINLIPVFYRAQQGVVRINGLPNTDYTLGSLRMHVGMVSQDNFLFDATVRENIAYAQPDAQMDTVEKVARMAYAHDFITRLDNGYETLIGERGVKLSGGQKQRITIARALLKNPPLLILDEATSALDTESERIVQKALENLMENRTSVVIAHRLSTVLGADKIVVMEAGRVVAEGPHAELLQTSPLYARLYAMQFKDEGTEEPGSCPA